MVFPFMRQLLFSCSHSDPGDPDLLGGNVGSLRGEVLPLHGGRRLCDMRTFDRQLRDHSRLERSRLQSTVWIDSGFQQITQFEEISLSMYRSTCPPEDCEE